jgi:transcriptional antiterminator RfaH
MKWYVIYTKRNFEIRVAKSLNAIGINAYCPVIEYVKQYSDRKKKVEKPVLPSYVLVNISEKERVNVFSIPGVLRYLFWLGKPAEVRQDEIDILKRELKGCIDIPENTLVKGKDFTIPSGPFKGFEGKILNLSNNKLRLKLESIGLFMTVNIS